MTLSRRGFIILILTSLLVIVVCYEYLLPPHWRAYESPDGRFTIDFPSSPSVQELPDTGLGISHIVAAKPTSRIVYACTWSDGPDLTSRSPDETLNRARDFGMQGVQGVLLNEKQIVVEGYPARDIQSQIRGNGAMDNRIILVGNRLYSLRVVNTNGEHDSKNVQKFFNSFTLRPSK